VRLLGGSPAQQQLLSLSTVACIFLSLKLPSKLYRPTNPYDKVRVQKVNFQIKGHFVVTCAVRRVMVSGYLLVALLVVVLSGQLSPVTLSIGSISLLYCLSDSIGFSLTVRQSSW
jgi:hypothetical protein